MNLAKQGAMRAGWPIVLQTHRALPVLNPSMWPQRLLNIHFPWCICSVNSVILYSKYCAVISEVCSMEEHNQQIPHLPSCRPHSYTPPMPGLLWGRHARQNSWCVRSGSVQLEEDHWTDPLWPCRTAAEHSGHNVMLTAVTVSLVQTFNPLLLCNIFRIYKQSLILLVGLSHSTVHLFC